MDVLRGIVQNILMIILLTILLEMLLPEGDMRRYVRLVMGLFVIMVVLNPVLGLFHSDINLKEISFNGAEVNGDLSAAVTRGKELGKQQKVRALTGLQEKINGQVMALVRLDKSVNVKGVEVEMVDDPEKGDFGQIKSIIVKTGKNLSGGRGGTVSQSKTGVPEIAPVEIKVPEVNEQRQRNNVSKPVIAGKESQLREVLADFYGLTPEQIKIIHQP